MVQLRPRIAERPTAPWGGTGLGIIFLSPSSYDQEAASELTRCLADVGQTAVFLDFDPRVGVPAGRNWEQEIHSNLRRCAAVILLVSEAWNASKWCFAEAKIASSLGKPIFVVRSDGAPLDASLLAVQAIDLSASAKDVKAEQTKLLAALVRAGLDPATGLALDRDRPPYPGLASFTAADAAVYCGRDDEIRAALEALSRLERFQAERWLLVLGASGAGKSSLMRAGIVPRLRDFIVIGPFRGVSRPLDALAEALLAAKLPGTFAQVRGRLDQLDDLVRELRSALGRPSATVLVALDQLEELLAPTDEAERLLSILAQAQVFVIATLRSDYLAELQVHRVLGSLSFASFPLSQMPTSRFGEAIAGPAARVGLELEPGLVETIVADAETADALPLVAFVLRELWERDHRDGRLRIATYRHVLGGLTGSLARAADAAIANASGEERHALRRTFLLLAALDEGGTYRRTKVRWEAIPHAARGHLDHLVAARLLVADEDGVEVAHEALFRVWPVLQQWLDDERAFLRFRSRFEPAFVDWTVSRRRALLLRGHQLQEAVFYRRTHGELLSDRQREFTDASARAALRARVAIAVGMLAVVAVMTALWVRARRGEADAEAQKVTITRALARSSFERGEDLASSDDTAADALPYYAKALELSPAGEWETNLAANRLLHLVSSAPRMTGTLPAPGVAAAFADQSGRTVLSVGTDGRGRIVGLDLSSVERGIRFAFSSEIPLCFERGDWANAGAEPPVDLVRAVSFSPDGRWVWQRCATELALYESRSGRRVSLPPMPEGTGIAFSDDATRFLVTGTQTRLGTLRGDRWEVTAIPSDLIQAERAAFHVDADAADKPVVGFSSVEFTVDDGRVKRTLTVDERARLAVLPTGEERAATLVTVEQHGPCRTAMFAGDALVLSTDRGIESWVEGQPPRQIPLPEGGGKRLIRGPQPRWVGIHDEVAPKESGDGDRDVGAGEGDVEPMETGEGDIDGDDDSTDSSVRVFDQWTGSLSEPIRLAAAAAAGVWLIDDRGAAYYRTEWPDGFVPMPDGNAYGGFNHADLEPVIILAHAKSQRVPFDTHRLRTMSLITALLRRSTVLALDASPGRESLSFATDRGVRFVLRSAQGESSLFAETATRLLRIDAPKFDQNAWEAVVSDDGRFIADSGGEDISVWTHTGVVLISSLAHGLGPFLDARFVRRGNTTYLQTISKDCALRTWFVFEDFADKPQWLLELPRLIYGRSLAADGAQQVTPGYVSGAERERSFEGLRKSKSPAAAVVRRHYAVE